VHDLDWDEILKDRTPYADLAFRRKEDQRAYPNWLVLGWRNGLSLPAGFNSGHQIGLLIDREMLPYFGLTSFDALPIPFRCVAADLVSGKEFIFKDGSLAKALRATMSIPGVFTPVRDGQRVYADGGLINNLPSDVAREMGADIVIAVHLSTQPVEAKNIRSFVNVLEQSVKVMIADSEVRGMANADAIVSVEVGTASMTDFKQNEPLIEKGYHAAEQRGKLLESFALDQTTWDQYIKDRESRRRTATPVPEFIEVQGTGADAQSDIRAFLKKFIGKPLDPPKLDRALTLLTGAGRYDRLDYQIAEQGGKQGLLILVHEKGLARATLQPAFEVDGSQAGDVEFRMGTRWTVMDAAGFRSEWRTDFQFGNTYGVASELYRPITAASKWFVAPHASASYTTFMVFERNDPTADYRFYRTGIGGDLGYGFNRFSELRVGYELGNVSSRLRLGTLQIPTIKGQVSAARLRFLLDHTDGPVVPRHGYAFETNFRWYDNSPGAPNAFPAMDAHLGYFHPVSRAGSVFLVSDGGTTFGFRDTGLPQFFLGGASKLSAYGRNELYGNQYYLLRGGYLHDLVTLPSLVGKKVYALATYEAGKVYGAPRQSRFPSDVAAGVLAETVVGPFFVGGSVGDTGHHKWFFQLGRVF
jgi:NTE family protein